MSNDLFGVVAVLVILGVGVVAFTPAFAAGSDRVSNVETLSVDYQDPQNVTQNVSEGGLPNADSVTVTNNGTELEPDIDYRWNETSGNVTFVNTSATSSGDDVEIQYVSREADRRQQIIGGVLEALGTPLVFLLFLLAGGYVFRELI